MGITAIHLPCQTIRDYFFAANRNLPWTGQEPLYRFLRLAPEASLAELRLGFRIRRMELKQARASKADFAGLERAYNLLADPRRRAAYNELFLKPDAPAPPLFRFRIGRRRGRPGGRTFFARRILAFLPERGYRRGQHGGPIDHPGSISRASPSPCSGGSPRGRPPRSNNTHRRR